MSKGTSNAPCIAATVFRNGHSQQCTTAGEVDANTRERAKRVVYGIIYGLSAFGLSQQLTEQGLTVEAADTLIKSFLNRFQGNVCTASSKTCSAFLALPIGSLHCVGSLGLSMFHDADVFCENRRKLVRKQQAECQRLVLVGEPHLCAGVKQFMSCC